ncbi:signal peptidase I [Nesterenkonia sp. MY13]|uniref:Signal peptidase I n=1 Tax=Nesterenkonia sedimenti TaxID=1463632 RepID=A0A7X8TK87_9MICC|nr:signal peptidase I [Nesterenkonia sedimenti]NLS10080.1 signal peptidase I [Nesterenkonia sedimenti]
MTAADNDAAIPPEEPQASGKRGKKKRHWAVSFLIELGVIVGLAVVISFIIKTFFLRAFYIPSESMQPTLEVDDRIVVNLLAPGVMDIHRGDVVVFEDTRNWWGEPAPETNPIQDAMIFIGLAPDTSSHYVVKRVVGLEGDQVQCCDDQGRILVNGEPIEEPYVFPGNDPSSVEFDVTVPEDHVWLLGDHRAASADSRSHAHEPDQGAVPEEDVIGRTLSIVWPVDRWGGGGSDREPFEHVPDPQ